MEGRPSLLRDLTDMRVRLTAGDRHALSRAIGRLSGTMYQAIGRCECGPVFCERCRTLSNGLRELEAQD